MSFREPLMGEKDLEEEPAFSDQELKLKIDLGSEEIEEEFEKLNGIFFQGSSELHKDLAATKQNLLRIKKSHEKTKKCSNILIIIVVTIGILNGILAVVLSTIYRKEIKKDENKWLLIILSPMIVLFVILILMIIKLIYKECTRGYSATFLKLRSTLQDFCCRHNLQLSTSVVIQDIEEDLFLIKTHRLEKNGHYILISEKRKKINKNRFLVSFPGIGDGFQNEKIS